MKSELIIIKNWLITSFSNCIWCLVCTGWSHPRHLLQILSEDHYDRMQALQKQFNMKMNVRAFVWQHEELLTGALLPRKQGHNLCVSKGCLWHSASWQRSEPELHIKQPGLPFSPYCYTYEFIKPSSQKEYHLHATSHVLQDRFPPIRGVTVCVSVHASSFRAGLWTDVVEMEICAK